MKTVFITPCFENGRDGVGDYTHRLVEQLRKIGNESIDCSVIAWNDDFVNQAIEKRDLLRLPSTFDERKKLELGCRFIRELNPDCISLQWVPFGYHPKGWFKQQIESFQQLTKDVPLHMMIHEIWLGAKLESTLKERLLGVGQKNLYKKLVKRVKPAWIHTQSRAYLHVLSEAGIQTSILPLFSNIKVTEKRRLTEGQIRLGFFGAIHPETRLEPLISPLLQLGKQKLSSLHISHAGRLSPGGKRLFESWQQQWGEEIDFQLLGEMSPEGISKFLSGLNFGISTNPLALLDKSGSIAAMFDHQLPVINLRDDVHFKNFEPQHDKSWVLIDPDVHKLKSYLEQTPNNQGSTSIEIIASNLLHTLKEISK